MIAFQPDGSIRIDREYLLQIVGGTESPAFLFETGTEAERAEGTMENKRIFPNPGYQRGQPEKSSGKPFSAFMACEAHLPAIFLSLYGGLPP